MDEWMDLEYKYIKYFKILNEFGLGTIYNAIFIESSEGAKIIYYPLLDPYTIK